MCPIRHSRITPAHLCLSIITGLTFLLIQPARSAPTDPPLITVSSGKVSLQCDQFSLLELLHALGRAMGTEVKIYPGWQDRPVSVNLANVGFEAAIRQLVGDNYAIVFSMGGQQPLTLFILNRSGEDYRQHRQRIQWIGTETPLSETDLRPVVAKQVLRMHPGAEFFDVVKQYRVNGDIDSYVYTFYTGGSAPPDPDDLRQSIAAAWQNRKKYIDDVRRGYEARDSGKIAAAAALAETAGQAMSREQDFVSIDISARTTEPPVRGAWNGLPLSVSQYPKALDAVKKGMLEHPVRMEKIYSTGLFSIVFEFDDRQKNKVFVDPRSGKIVTGIEGDRASILPLSEDQPTWEEQDRNRKKWMAFLEL